MSNSFQKNLNVNLPQILKAYVPSGLAQPQYPTEVIMFDSGATFATKENTCLFLVMDVLEDEQITVSKVHFYTATPTEWSEQPQVDNSVFNGFALYHQTGDDQYDLIAKTENISNFLCRNGTPETANTIFTNDISFESPITIGKGRYFLCIQNKTTNNPEEPALFALEYLYYTQSISNFIQRNNVFYGVPLVQKWNQPLFVEPPSTITPSIDLTPVENNDNGDALPYYLKVM